MFWYTSAAIVHPGPPLDEVEFCAAWDRPAHTVLRRLIDSAVRCACLDLYEALSPMRRVRKGDLVTAGFREQVLGETPQAQLHLRALALRLTDLLWDPDWPDGLCESEQKLHRFLVGIGLSHLRTAEYRGDGYESGAWIRMEFLLGQTALDRQPQAWSKADDMNALEYAYSSAQTYLQLPGGVGFEGISEAIDRHKALQSMREKFWPRDSFGRGHVQVIRRGAQLLLGQPDRGEIVNTMRHLRSLEGLEAGQENVARNAFKVDVERYEAELDHRPLP